MIAQLFANLIWSVIGGFFGAVIALLLEKKLNSPELKITLSEDANVTVTYSQGVPVPGRWKYFSAYVINEPLGIWSRITGRETALQVHAQITFKQLKVLMKGRWANTLQLPYANSGDWVRLVTFPEPVNIPAGEREVLNIIAKYENDEEAYGWNNEAYLSEWRTSRYKLSPGDYIVEISLMGNNVDVRGVIRAHVGKTIEETYLKEV